MSRVLRPLFPRGPPHNFTKNSTTGEKSEDDLHITAQINDPIGRLKVHIYVQREINGQYSVVDESVMKNGKFERRFCTGRWAAEDGGGSSR